MQEACSYRFEAIFQTPSVLFPANPYSQMRRRDQREHLFENVVGVPKESIGDQPGVSPEREVCSPLGDRQSDQNINKRLAQDKFLHSECED